MTLLRLTSFVYLPIVACFNWFLWRAFPSDETGMSLILLIPLIFGLAISFSLVDYVLVKKQLLSKVTRFTGCIILMSLSWFFFPFNDELTPGHIIKSMNRVYGSYEALSVNDFLYYDFLTYEKYIAAKTKFINEQNPDFIFEVVYFRSDGNRRVDSNRYLIFYKNHSAYSNNPSIKIAKMPRSDLFLFRDINKGDSISIFGNQFGISKESTIVLSDNLFMELDSSASVKVQTYGLRVIDDDDLLVYKLFYYWIKWSKNSEPHQNKA